MTMGIYGAGRMVGDFECINDLPYQTTVFSVDQKAQVYEIAKEDFMRLKTENKIEYWQDIEKQSNIMAKEFLKSYTEKLKTFIELKKRNNQMNPDMQQIQNTLMKETMFSYPKEKLKKMTSLRKPQTVVICDRHKSIELYSMKKHLQDIPELKDKVLSQLKRTQFQNLQNSQWAKEKLNQRHSLFEQKQSDVNFIDQKSIENDIKANERKAAQRTQTFNKTIEFPKGFSNFQKNK